MTVVVHRGKGRRCGRTFPAVRASYGMGWWVYATPKESAWFVPTRDLGVFGRPPQ